MLNQKGNWKMTKRFAFIFLLLMSALSAHALQTNAQGFVIYESTDDADYTQMNTNWSIVSAHVAEATNDLATAIAAMQAELAAGTNSSYSFTTNQIAILQAALTASISDMETTNAAVIAAAEDATAAATNATEQISAYTNLVNTAFQTDRNNAAGSNTTNDFTASGAAVLVDTPTTGNQAANKSYADTAAASVGLPSGTVIQSFANNSPTGYLYCNGAAVSRETYSALFAAIGSSCGSGDGSTTFNLPDLRGRFLRGQDDGASRDPDDASRTAMNSGGNTGDTVGSVQAGQYASHTHTYTAKYNGSTGYWALSQSGQANGSATTMTSGSNGGNETRPLNASVRFYIKY